MEGYSYNDVASKRNTTLRKSQKRGNFLLPEVEQTRKLINEILKKLRKRKKPPSVFQDLELYEFGESVKVNKQHNSSFNNDITCELVNQLKDVLSFCSEHDIKFGNRFLPINTPPESPYSSRTHSPNRSRSPSPTRFGGKASTVLDRILDILSDIIYNDCRYKNLSPRPFRPPYTLQLEVIDVAILLIDQNPYSPKWLYELGTTMMAGFVYFSEGMLSKLLTFYATSLIPQLMACKGQTSRPTVMDNRVYEDLSPPRARKVKIADDKDVNLSNIQIIIDPADTKTPTINVQSSDKTSFDDNHGPILSEARAPSFTSQRSSPYIFASYSGESGMDEHYIDSLFTPLLYSMLQNINVQKSTLETIYRMHQTLGIMIEHKPDLYYDIIEIIAQGDEDCRQQAINVLFFFWNNSTGHPAVGEPLPQINYADDMAAKLGGAPTNPSEIMKNDDALHRFLSHIFPKENETMNASKHKSFTVPRRTSLLETHGQFLPTENPNCCIQCFKPVYDFGLKCGGCHVNFHFTCYNMADGGIVGEYLLQSGIHKLSTPQFCDVVASPRRQYFRSQPESMQTVRTVCGHQLVLVNLFTLVLCLVCHKPLWGVMYQGYRCKSCNRFTHIQCLLSAGQAVSLCQPSAMSEADAVIEHEELRHSFLSYYGNILVPLDVIPSYSVEEISVMLSILTMQDNILRNGILAGCLFVRGNFANPLSPRTDQFDQFELQETIKRYESYLEKMKPPLSPLSQEFWDVFDVYPSQILSAEDYIGHLAALMKHNITIDLQDDNSNRLSVNMLAPMHPEQIVNNSPSGVIWSGEMVKWLRNNLSFKGTYTVEVFIQQMANFGFIERIDGLPVIFFDNDSAAETECIFPLPFAIECSPHVESLISAISVCLSDINIAINECGMLLLTKRCWPDPFLSKYTLERLIAAIIVWICQEDEKLIIIAEESLEFRRGVRDEMDDDQFAHQRRTSSHVNAGGGVYVKSRKMLKEKYILGWMNIVHDMNPRLFCDIVYNQLLSVEETHPSIVQGISIKGGIMDKQERVMKLIVKLGNSGVLFSSLDSIMNQWFIQVHQIFKNLPPENVFVDLKALQKVFSTRASTRRESGSERTSQLLAPDTITTDFSEPFQLLTRLFVEQNVSSIKSALAWMEVLIRGGVGLPESIFSDFFPYLANTKPPLGQYALYLKLMWYQVLRGYGALINRGKIVQLVTATNNAAVESISKIQNDGEGRDIQVARQFIKTTLALTLYAYACSLDFISELNIAMASASSTSVQKRLSTLPDPTPGANLTEDAPLIQFLFRYLTFDKLGLRDDIVKTFWGLFNRAGLVYNKDDFMLNCVSTLLPSVWETLTPCYDVLSEYNMKMLMKLVWLDTRRFVSFVSNLFEHTNWEVRYKALDNLYGLFSKLDEKVDVQYAGLFASLGPVFSYFVACLWDQEEFVRTKASTYIRSMQPTHIRLALKCWQGYFESANDRERMILTKFMVRFNGKFPAWQVIEWDILLKALGESDGVGAVSTEDILESYMRPDSILVIGLKRFQDGDITDAQKVAESDNLKVLLLNLSLQMLGNGIEISVERLMKLKQVVATCLGFAEVQQDAVNGEIYILHSEFEYIPDNFSQNTRMLSILSNLKKVMDTPIYLQKENELTDESRTAAETDEPLVGGYFVDIILKMFCSSVDLASLNHIMLKIFLELILIIVYKHKIDDKESKHLEELLVTAMKRTSELLIRDISQENKQLIIELCVCLLKRAPMLTVTILGKQIITLGKLMTMLRNDPQNEILQSAKSFLKAAFLRFSKNGLFVLILKNQAVADSSNTELDMFWVLRIVIGNEIISSEDEGNGPVYLKEQPIRDVMNQLFKLTNRRVFSTILFNVNKYVESVYSKPYSEQLLNDLGTFFTKLSKHTGDWKRSDWDVNPVLNMAAIILRNNPINAKSLVFHVRTLLRHAIHKCTTTVEVMVKLLSAYNLAAEEANLDVVNPFGEILIEELKYALRTGKYRMHINTFMILLQLILWDLQPSSCPRFRSLEFKSVNESDDIQRRPYFVNVADSIFDDCINFLENPLVTKQYSKREFNIGICTSQLIVAMCNNKYDLLKKIFLWQKSVDVRRTRLLNWILLAMLKLDNSGLITTIFDFQDNIAELLSNALQSPFNEILNPDQSYLDTPSGEQTYQAFILIKTWTILCAQASQRTDESKSIAAPRLHRRLATSLAMAERRFWNTIWPVMKRQLTSNIVGRDVEPKGIAYWEMFLDLITFLHLSGSDIILLYSQEWCTLLDDLTSPRDDNSNVFKNKIRKARSMFDDPPLEANESELIKRLFAEMSDAMKLYSEVHANQVLRFFGPY
ncbi:9817_t:CDS:10 [Paraglomus occultum]|uniref:9817_t:CDS:1 n=1 Tax=Paraglomus occultum TaxID=144539 RepID=A0A9N8YZE9_9GLOM|nr:9817_t:CDS:10 [Paraglomus occultum]